MPWVPKDTPDEVESKSWLSDSTHRKLKNSLGYIWGVIIFVAVVSFTVWRVVYIHHQSQIASCPNKSDTLVVDYFAIPFVQPVLSCESN